VDLRDIPQRWPAALQRRSFSRVTEKRKEEGPISDVTNQSRKLLSSFLWFFFFRLCG
jgi:hypothetical protein